MMFYKSKENSFKHGNLWFYLNDSHDKNIGFEWSFRPFDIFNFSLTIDGGEGDYTFCFWFIFVFYISFSNIFKYYPKEWNSMTNNGKGGFLRSARRVIGVQQYATGLNFYVWHNGEDSWYLERGQKDWQNKKDFKIYNKYILLDRLLLGDHVYNTLFKDVIELYLKLPEDTYKLKVKYYIIEKKYKRLLSRILNKKYQSYLIENSGIKVPNRSFGTDEEMPSYRYRIGIKDEHSKLIENYKRDIMIRRKDPNWVPKEYALQFERKKKLDKLLTT